MSLVMDVKLPGMSWARIKPEHVSKASRGRREERTPLITEILAISAEDEPEQVGGPGVGGDGDGDEDMDANVAQE